MESRIKRFDPAFFSKQFMVSAAAIEPPGIIVGVADLQASNKPNAIITTYALGSCLGVSGYDPMLKAGALLHAMLPDSKKIDSPRAAPPMFLDTGIQDLLQTLRRFGCNTDRCIFKVFGGARVLQAEDYFNIGSRNIAMMEDLALLYHLRVAVWEVGGQTNRTIRLHLNDGSIRLRMPGRPEVFV